MDKSELKKIMKNILTDETIKSIESILMPLTHRYGLTMIKKYADKYNIKIYDGFINSSNSKAIKYGYHIKHFHMLCKTHQIPTKSIPQRWGNIEKQPLKSIVNEISF